MFSFPKQWPTSDSDGILSFLIVAIPLFACIFLTWHFANDTKLMKENYQKHIDAAGYRVPQTMDEALLWIAESESIPSRNGVWLNVKAFDERDILTNTDGLTTPNYGWGAVCFLKNPPLGISLKCY